MADAVEVDQLHIELARQANALAEENNQLKQVIRNTDARWEAFQTENNHILKKLADQITALQKDLDNCERNMLHQTDVFDRVTDIFERDLAKEKATTTRMRAALLTIEQWAIEQGFDTVQLMAVTASKGEAHVQEKEESAPQKMAEDGSADSE